MPANPMERRAHVFQAARMVTYLTIGAMILACITIVVVAIIAVLRPEQILVVVPLITAVTMPLILGIMALAQNRFSTVTDGQLGQLLHAVAGKEYAQGKLDGVKEEAPKLVRGDLE